MFYLKSLLQKCSCVKDLTISLLWGYLLACRWIITIKVTLKTDVNYIFLFLKELLNSICSIIIWFVQAPTTQLRFMFPLTKLKSQVSLKRFFIMNSNLKRCPFYVLYHWTFNANIFAIKQWKYSCLHLCHSQRINVSLWKIWLDMIVHYLNASNHS